MEDRNKCACVHGQCGTGSTIPGQYEKVTVPSTRDSETAESQRSYNSMALVLYTMYEQKRNENMRLIHPPAPVGTIEGGAAVRQARAILPFR